MPAPAAGRQGRVATPARPAQHDAGESPQYDTQRESRRDRPCGLKKVFQKSLPMKNVLFQINAWTSLVDRPRAQGRRSWRAPDAPTVCPRRYGRGLRSMTPH